MIRKPFALGETVTILDRDAVPHVGRVRYGLDGVLCVDDDGDYTPIISGVELPDSQYE